MTKRSSSNKKPASPAPASSGGSANRSRTRERRAERQKQKQKQRQIQILVVVSAVVIVGMILFILVNQPASAPIPEGTLERYDNLPTSFTDDGFAVLGSPNAPVRVEEFSSFSCPGCAAFHDTWSDTIEEQVRAGVISFTYYPLTLGAIPNARGAANSAFCAGEQDSFWEYHDVLFDWHRTFGNQAFTQNRMESGAENLGLNVNDFNSCVNSSRPEQTLTNAERVAGERGVTSTPTLFVNGVEWDGASDLEAVIQNALISTGLPPVDLDLEDEPAAPVEDATDEAETTEEAEVTDEPEVETDATEEVEDTPSEDATAEAEATEESE